MFAIETKHNCFTFFYNNNDFFERTDNPESNNSIVFIFVELFVI